jgi:hypothetical protein
MIRSLIKESIWIQVKNHVVLKSVDYRLQKYLCGENAQIASRLNFLEALADVKLTIWVFCVFDGSLFTVMNANIFAFITTKTRINVVVSGFGNVITTEITTVVVTGLGTVITTEITTVVVSGFGTVITTEITTVVVTGLGTVITIEIVVKHVDVTTVIVMQADSVLYNNPHNTTLQCK